MIGNRRASNATDEYRSEFTVPPAEPGVCSILQALIPIAASIIGGGISAATASSAAGKAADASQAATDKNAELQREALAIQQSNTATSRAVGDAAILELAKRFGLSVPQAQAVVADPSQAATFTGGGQAPAAASNAGQPNWDAYLAQDPGLMKEFDRVNSEGRYLQGMGITTPQQFAQWHYQTKGQSEGRQVPTFEAPAQQAAAAPAPAPVAAVDPAAPPPPVPTQGAASIDQQGYYTAPRPLPQAAPTYVAPTYRETAVAPLDVGIDKYTKSPDYEFQQEEGNKNILATASATGGLESGAALKALQKFGQDLAMGDYGQWRDYTTGQYNNDRSFTANRDDAYNSFGQSTALAKFGADQSNYQYGTSLGQSIYESDRGYSTSRYDTGNNALMNLANMGQGATQNYNSALSNSATNQGNAYFANANNQGNAALAAAGQIGSTINNGANALAYYYGNQGSKGYYDPTVSSTRGGASSAGSVLSSGFGYG